MLTASILVILVPRVDISMAFSGISIAGYRWFLACLLVAMPCFLLAQSGTVESDPAVVKILPKHYPLNRVRVDAREYPWSAIGLLAMGGLSTCSGALVAERYVLTAAHCVFQWQRFPREINFLAGFQQHQYVAHSKAKRVHLSKRFRSMEPSLQLFATDWALVELVDPIGKKAGYLGWASFDEQVLEGIGDDAAVLKISGYRGDRRFVQTVDHECRISGFTPDSQLIVHQCPITMGDSGGPLLLPYRGQLLVVGIETGMIETRDAVSLRPVRYGYAAPSTSFQGKLIQLGIGGKPLRGSEYLIGRFGRRPR